MVLFVPGGCECTRLGREFADRSWSLGPGATAVKLETPLVHARTRSRCADGIGAESDEPCGFDEGSVHAQNPGVGFAVFDHLDVCCFLIQRGLEPAMASEGQAAPLVRNLVAVSAQSVDAKALIARVTGDGDKHGVADYSVGSVSPASSRDSSPLYVSSWFPSQLSSSQRAAPLGASNSRDGSQMKSATRGRLKEDAAALDCVCGGKRGDWREARFGSGWHDDCQEEEAAPACSGRMCKVCKCAAGLTADCAAVCCCPLSVLHLLVLGCVKLPCIVVYKGYRSIKRRFRKRRRSVPRYEQEDSLRQKSSLTIDLSSYTEPEPMSPKPGGFGDHAMWREYFGSEGSNATAAVNS